MNSVSLRVRRRLVPVLRPAGGRQGAGPRDPARSSAQTVDAGKVQFDAIRPQYADYRGAALAKRTAANKALDP